MVVYYHFAESQAETGPWVLSGRAFVCFRGEKHVENIFQVARLNSAARIGDCYFDRIGFVRRIPRKRIGTGAFSQTMQRVFWTQVFAATGAVNVDLFRRFVRWVRGRG